jgi:cation:H+ antiporter
MNTLITLLFWLFIIIVSSYFLAEGADRLGFKIGRRFMGRTILGIATTLPEIAIVFVAASKGILDVGIGATFGSNVLMITLGLSLMVLIATTKLSLNPAKELNVSFFKLDFYYLLLTAVVSVITFMNGYDIYDAIIFAGLYIGYVYQSYKESHKERTESINEGILTRKQILLYSLFIIFGSLGIFVGAGPFTENLKKYSIEIGVPAVILALIIAPIGGEMPEKLSMMLLARKGGKSVEISIGNVFGSKILNNTLLITFFILGALTYGHSVIPSEPISFTLVAMTSILTSLSMLTFVDRKLDKKDGFILFVLYIVAILIQILIVEFKIFH